MRPVPTPAISVVVPARDAAATIGRTLEALAGQSFGGVFEVIVVDDGSSDGTDTVAHRAPGPVIVLDGPGLGAAAARNAGAAAARAPVLAFTDADCYPAPDWLAEGLAAIGDADLVQGAVRPDPDAVFGPFDHSIWVVGESGLYETANLFVRKDLFDRLGGFRDWLGARGGRPMGEDVLFGWSARRAGARVAYRETALVHHAVLARTARAYVRERLRLAHFPAMARRIPELRDHLFFARWFLSPRAASFDAAVVAGIAAALARSPVPLVLALPYLTRLTRRSGRFGARAPWVAAVELAADATGLGALLWGSLRHRSLLL